MKITTRPIFLFVDEGAAFAELEGRHLDTSRKAEAMNTHNQDSTNEDHDAAPVEAWDAIAADYDTHVAPGEAGLATEALKLAGLQPGQRFLDVAAGPGGLALPAARMGAKVVATDWSPRMIERFNARVTAAHISDAEGKVMECHRLGFPDDTFDVTGSLFGVMLVSDQPRALREMVRVTKQSGRVVLIAYGPPTSFEALHWFIDGLRAVNPAFEGLPSNPPPLAFQVSDPEVLRRRLTDAGLRNVTVDTSHEETLEIRSGRQLWDWCLGGNPIPNMLVADLSEEQKAAMRAQFDDKIRARSNGKTFVTLTAALNIGIGTK